MRNLLFTNFQEVTGETQKLDKQRCTSVLIQAKTVKLDGSQIQPDADGNYDRGNVTLWGFDGFLVNELFIGAEVEIPTENAERIQFKNLAPEAGQLLAVNIFLDEE